MSKVHEAVDHYSRLLSAAWSDETANPISRPLPKGKDPSYGQCEVGSAVLLRELRNDFPHELFSLAYGRVLSVAQNAGRLTLKPIIFCHVWIHWGSVAFPLADAEVVDIASGQAEPPSLPAVVHEKYDDLNKRGIAYQPGVFYEDPEQLGDALRQYDTNFDERLSLLQSRFEQLAARA